MNINDAVCLKQMSYNPTVTIDIRNDAYIPHLLKETFTIIL